jgi:hypothetical protein
LDDHEIVEDESHSARPGKSRTEVNVTKVKVLVMSDRHLTVNMIGSELNLNRQTSHGILTKELGK